MSDKRSLSRATVQPTTRCVIVSRHGRRRVRQRIGTRHAESLAERAYEQGLTIDLAKGRLQKHLQSLKHKSASNGETEVRAYKGNVYLFRGAILVTVLPLPGPLRQHLKSQSEKQ